MQVMKRVSGFLSVLGLVSIAFGQSKEELRLEIARLKNDSLRQSYTINDLNWHLKQNKNENLGLKKVADSLQAENKVLTQGIGALKNQIAEEKKRSLVKNLKIDSLAAVVGKCNQTLDSLQSLDNSIMGYEDWCDYFGIELSESYSSCDGEGYRMPKFRPVKFPNASNLNGLTGFENVVYDWIGDVVNAKQIFVFTGDGWVLLPRLYSETECKLVITREGDIVDPYGQNVFDARWDGKYLYQW